MASSDTVSIAVSSNDAVTVASFVSVNGPCSAASAATPARLQRLHGEGDDDRPRNFGASRSGEQQRSAGGAASHERTGDQAVVRSVACRALRQGDRGKQQDAE